MAAFNDTDALPILKELYPSGSVPRELWYKNAPLLALLPKDEDAYGEHVKVPLLYGHPQGRSASFTKARTNVSGSKYAAFEVDTKDDYAVAQITGRAIDKGKKDRGSFIRTFKGEMQGSQKQLRRSIVHALYRNGGGAIGQVGAYTPGASTFTLADVRDAVFLEVGMTLQADTTDGTSGTVHAGTAIITALNRRTGVVTSGSAWDAQITGFAANDFIFTDGDFGVKAHGMDAWIPASDPSATPFNGVNRAVDTVRLGGVRHDISTMPLEEGLIEGTELVVREGGEPDVIIVHTKTFANLAKAMGSKVTFGTKDAYDAKISFKTIKLVCSHGDVDVIGDPNCQGDVGWALQLDTWTCYSMGPMPRFIDDDGNPYLRQHDSDGVEIRSVARWNLGCGAPGWNGRFKLA
jgi:hypothetical protein